MITVVPLSSVHVFFDNLVGPDIFENTSEGLMGQRQRVSFIKSQIYE